MKHVRCHICDRPDVVHIPGFDGLVQVTSDCRPWHKGGCLAVCQRCRTVQKPYDRKSQADIEAIYGDYEPYHQGSGADQKVMDTSSGGILPRSEKLVGYLEAHGDMGPYGRYLDIGCGNGNLLKAFHQRFRGWELAGAERGDRQRDRVLALEGVDTFYSRGIDSIPKGYDGVSLVHTLEHIRHPVSFLRRVRSLLNPTGWLLVEVPDYRSNPFDLIIADHCTHFDPSTVSAILACAGFSIAACTHRLVPKELTYLARPAQSVASALEEGGGRKTIEAVTKGVRWLVGLADQATTLCRESGLGVFGTSIAATWLAGIVGEHIEFFVDEDLSRVGRNFMGRPVVSPDRVPRGKRVFIALAPTIARRIAEKYRCAAFASILPDGSENMPTNM